MNNQWHSVLDKMPAKDQTVIATYEYKGIRHTIRAQYIRQFEEESYDCDDAEYDEKTDTTYAPEGWYELADNWPEYESFRVNGVVTHWTEMPKFVEERHD